MAVDAGALNNPTVWAGVPNPVGLKLLPNKFGVEADVVGPPNWKPVDWGFVVAIPNVGWFWIEVAGVPKVMLPVPKVGRPVVLKHNNILQTHMTLI